MVREQEKLFQAATLHSKFTSDDLCTYSMYNGNTDYHFELYQTLIEELVKEGKLIKLQYDPNEDTFYKFREYANPEFIVAYQRNWFYGEEPMNDEEFVSGLLKIKEVK